MSTPYTKKEDDLLQVGRSYANTVRRALLRLLAGGGLLASARFLRLSGTSEALTVIATSAEVLGWGFLVFSTAVLWVEWKEQKKQLHDPRGSLIWRGDSARADRWSHSRLLDVVLHSREDAIDRLYAELRPLMSRAATDPSLREEVEAKLSRLRELQSAEADEMQKRFEAELLLKPGEGWQALDRARELLARYENSPSPNPTPERHR